MAVPSFQDMMLPLLIELQDGQEHAIDELAEALAVRLKLTPEDRKETIPSGNQQKFENRVGWAKTYLKKAQLIETVGRGRFTITDSGREVLKSGVQRVDMKYLERFPAYQEFRKRQPAKNGKGDTAAEPESQETPLESLDESFQAIRRVLAQEILDRVRGGAPHFFERLVVDLLVRMGYGGSRPEAGRRVGQSGDGGIDGVIDEDRLGLDVVCIQAKRWTTQTVGRPDIQAFVGSLEGRRARKGVFITTSTFSKDAREYVKAIDKRVVLIDGERLAELMIDHDVGVTGVTQYVVKKVDQDYFAGEI